MKKHKITYFFILALNLLLPGIFLTSCSLPYRPKWNLNNQNFESNKNKQNAIYENKTSDEDKSDFTIEGDFKNKYGISKNDILEIFKNFKFELTNKGKTKTNNEIFKLINEILRKKLLPKGIYFKDGKMSFEDIFNTEPKLKELFKIVWPNYKNLDENYYEVRYKITNIENGKLLENSLIISATLYHSDKHHIDRNISDDLILNRHDTGVSVGPTFYYRIKGFK